MTQLGGHELTHGGKTVEVAFPWASISILQETWGADTFFNRVIETFSTKNVDDLAFMLAVGTGLKMTPRDVMEWSPPVMPTFEVIRKSWTEHWLGDKHLATILAAEAAAEKLRQKQMKDDSEEEVVDPPKPQTMKARLWGWLNGLWPVRSKQELATATSGPNLQP